MMPDARAVAAVTELDRRIGVLLGFAEPAVVGPVAARLGRPVLESVAGRDVTDDALGRAEAIRALATGANRWMPQVLPPSMLMWLLERDDPDLNAAVIRDFRIADGIRRDVLNGVPFGVDPSASGSGAGPGPGARTLPRLVVTAQPPPAFNRDYPDFTGVGEDGALPVAAETTETAEPAASETPTTTRDPDPNDPRGLIAALRRIGRAERIKPARTLAAQVSRADWELIAAADRQAPLSGYVRWALATRLDCPDRVREQFGSWQPRFQKRMRKAGVIRDLTRLLAEESSAGHALEILSFGRWAFAGRIGAAEELIGDLVRDELGGNVEAWAVFAQLLPEFGGSLSELLVTAGAIGHAG